MNDEEAIKKYKEAGKIIAEVREESKKLIKEGMLLGEISDRIENLIREKGAIPGFPTCLSINDMAAHYSPGKNDNSVVPQGALLKVDIGAHIDGFVADTAYTIAFNDENKKLVEASEAALAAAIEESYTGNLVSNISVAIEKTIKDFGFNPISNLTGHGLAQYWLHDKPSIPNIKFTGNQQLVENQSIAIEPFATTGIGKVKDAEFTTIFRIDQPKPVRNPDARKIIDFALGIGTLPFSERWLPIDSVFRIKLALRELREKEIIYEYPALREVSNGLVSQTEHSIIVSDKPIVLTK